MRYWYRGQGHWSDMAADRWNDWVWQLQNRLTGVDDLERYLTLTPGERAGCELANRKLAQLM